MVKGLLVSIPDELDTLIDIECAKSGEFKKDLVVKMLQNYFKRK